MPVDERLQIRRERAKPITETLHRWLIAQRQRVPQGSGTARAIDYILKRWETLTRSFTMAMHRSTTTGWRIRSPLGERAVELPLTYGLSTSSLLTEVEFSIDATPRLNVARYGNSLRFLENLCTGS